MQQFVPLFDNVLITPDKREEKSKGGIIIPEKVSKSIVQGEIYAVGPKVPEHIKKGMRVIYNKTRAVELPLNEIEYAFINVTNIFCFIEVTD